MGLELPKLKGDLPADTVVSFFASPDACGAPPNANEKFDVAEAPVVADWPAGACTSAGLKENMDAGLGASVAAAGAGDNVGAGKPDAGAEGLNLKSNFSGAG